MRQASGQHGGNNFEIGVRMNSPSFSNLTLRNVENTMLEKQRLQNLLKSSNEALLTFTTELKRIKKVIMAAVLTDDMDSTRMDSETAGGAGSSKVGAQSRTGAQGANLAGNTAVAGTDIAPASNQAGANQNMDALLKRLMKFKHLEDDNKKLKNLLK